LRHFLAKKSENGFRSLHTAQIPIKHKPIAAYAFVFATNPKLTEAAAVGYVRD